MAPAAALLLVPAFGILLRCDVSISILRKPDDVELPPVLLEDPLLEELVGPE